MSTIAHPIPRLLKEPKSGVRMDAKRMENSDRLLRWAVEYIKALNDDLADCHTDGAGFIPNADVRLEVRRCRKWIALAEVGLQRKRR